ncbi:T-cell differentiation antigen CD6 [Microcaecilia unicolor]|uniref:T-cell differentiation antigen CD6 n=1 Tax=Microcaecilia unicolor TaxID=1415580 RepID=A0A6P7WV16_9AMPH|nr:T-cell differentiation antigen CD6 [Microcaecilia unicolor]
MAMFRLPRGCIRGYSCNQNIQQQKLSSAYRCRPEPTESTMVKQTPSDSTESMLVGQQAQPLVRLVNGTSSCGGTVQLRHQGEWMALCSDFAEHMIASIICKELQCGTARSPETTMYEKGTPSPENAGVMTNQSSVFFLSMHCPGSEEGLENCSLARLSPASCASERAAIITCTAHRELRLVGTSSRCAGRVEFEIDGRWGTVCDDSWDLHDADVVCRQLRCGSALDALGASHFGKGVDPIYMDEVNCTGNESHIWDCPAEEHHDCGHKEDAGVICSEHRELRLSGGQDHCAGRAEVFFQGTWATVCDAVWYPDDRDLLCHFLGCGAAVLQLQFQHTLPGRISFLCQQNVTSPWDCSHFFNNTHVCGQSAAVGLICTGSLGILSTTVAMEGTEEMTSRPIHGRTGAPVLVKDEKETSKDPTLLSICIILAVLLLGTVLAFAFFVFRRRKKQVSPVLVHHSLQTSNVPSTENNDYRNPSSNTTKTEEPALTSSHHQTEDSDYEDYDFSSKPPLALSTFYNSLRYKPIDDHVQQNTPMALLQEDVDGPDSENSLSGKVQEQENYYNQLASSSYPVPPCPVFAASPKASQVAEDTSSTSSEEEGWYENFRAPRAENLPPVVAVPSSGPQAQEDSTDCEYDDIDSST